MFCCFIYIYHYVLYHQGSAGYDCIAEFDDLLGWTDKHALPVLGVKIELDSDDGKQANRKLVYDIVGVCILYVLVIFSLVDKLDSSFTFVLDIF